MTAKRLLLIGWDDAGLHVLNPMLDAGHLPAINQVIEEGAVGSLGATAPPVGAAQWTTIFTGKRAWQHGVALPVEFDLAHHRALPVSANARNAAALWEMFGQRGLRSIVAGFPATHGCQSKHLTLISDRYPDPTAPPGVRPWPPAAPGCYWPESARAILDPLRVSPEDVGAGVISAYVPNWRKIDSKRDRRLGKLRVALARELSLCAAFEALLRRQRWEFAAIHLPAMREIASFSACPGTPPADSYAGAFRAQCETINRILKVLRAAAGPETAVVLLSCASSANSVTRRDFAPGLFAAAGNGFAPDALICGATVLDVAPTLLAWFGLPLGDDMEGRALMEAFSQRGEMERVASWETPGGTRGSPAAPVPERARLDWEWNMAQSALEAGRADDALPRLRFLARAFPERADFCQALFDCDLRLGLAAEAADTLEVLLDALPRGAPALLARAELALARKDRSGARRIILEVLAQPRLDRASQRRLGLLLLRLRQWEALAQLAQAAVERDPNDAVAWLGLATASLRLGQFETAEDAARRAIQIRYLLAEAHLILSRALLAQAKWDAAREAMAATLKLQPGNRALANYERLVTRKTHAKE